ncbi:hypothetical protein L0222_25435 [bacterium]|nr:hypothetical protein [bacterium]MCI0601882.1 hypothetical protein [bacterium]
MRYLSSFVIVLYALLTTAANTNVPQVMAVTVLTADLLSQTVFAKSVDGNKQTFRMSSKTPVSSLAQAGMNRSLHGGAGYQFIVHYQMVQGEKVATAFHYIGREEWKRSNGMVALADTKLRTIVLKPEEGSEEKFVAGQYCAVQTASGAKTFSAWTKENAGAEVPATLYYTVIKNGKVAHLIELSEATK